MLRLCFSLSDLCIWCIFIWLILFYNAAHSIWLRMCIGIAQSRAPHFEPAISCSLFFRFRQVDTHCTYSHSLSILYYALCFHEARLKSANNFFFHINYLLAHMLSQFGVFFIFIWDRFVYCGLKSVIVRSFLQQQQQTRIQCTENKNMDENKKKMNIEIK